MEDVVKMMDAHAGVAAWVQSAGAILALALSIWLTRGDKRERGRAAKTRARSAALAVFPEFVDVRAELSWALGQIDTGAKPEDIGNTGPEESDTIRFWHTPVMPPRLEGLRPMLHELGEAAEPAQRAYFALLLLRREFKDFMAQQYFEGPEEIWAYSEQEWSRTHTLAQMAMQRVQNAVDAIGRLL